MRFGIEQLRKKQNAHRVIVIEGYFETTPRAAEDMPGGNSASR